MGNIGSMTLGDVAERTAVLNVACSRCERAGRYHLDSLITQHGADFGIPLLLRALSTDCPKRQSSGSAYDLCGIHCPDLPALFLPLGDGETRRLDGSHHGGGLFPPDCAVAAFPDDLPMPPSTALWVS
jgi:hypothetical protein